MIEVESSGCYYLNTKNGIYLHEAVIDISIEKENIKKICKKIKNKIYEVNDFNELKSVLESSFNEYKVTFLFSDSNENDFIKAGGFNVSEMRIFIFFHPSLEKTIDEKNEEDYELFCNQLTTILGHEIIHRFQALKIEYEELRKKIFKKSKTEAKKYLSNKHEVMAYAWQIINSFKIYGLDYKEIRHILSLGDSSTKFILGGQIFSDYHDLFSMKDDTLKLLYKYMYLYLSEK